MAFKLDFLGAKINELLHKIDNLDPDDFGKIDTIKVNGTPQTITDKTVNITVPTQASDIGAMPSGTVSVANGGTGATTLASGQALIGNDAGSVTTKAITDNTAKATLANNNTNLVTGRSVNFHSQSWTNRTNTVATANTAYSTYMARGEALFSTDTNPTANGCIAWTYA